MFYLKYRPQTIAELDNERIKETLGKALLNDEWGHAYLLLGTRGSGKTTTARLIAKIVNCTSRKIEEEPCNKCDSCIAITEGRSLDVIEIDAASNTGVEDIRELRERVKLAPTGSKYKVYIIDEVHMLSTSAFNALLKTLEEPPEHVIFVLATTEEQKLPATITSRCLVYDFGRASKQEIVSSLKRKIKLEKIEVENGVLENIAEKADGSFRDADKILEQLSVQNRKLTLELVRTAQGSDATASAAKNILSKLCEKNAKAGLETVEKFAAENGSIKLLMTELINRLKGILLLRNGIQGEYEEVSLANDEIQKLIYKLIEANGFMRESPVAQLPLEMVIVEYSNQPNLHELATNLRESSRHSGEPKTTTPPFADASAGKPESPSVDSEKKEILDTARMTNLTSDASMIIEKWQDILNAVKPYNHNLSALLRSSRAKKIEGEFLIIEAFYKFHLDKLSEAKNRETVERVISDIMGKEIKVKFGLAEMK